MHREVTRWALRKAGVEKWLVSTVVIGNVDGALTVVKRLGTLDSESESSEVF